MNGYLALQYHDNGAAYMGTRSEEHVIVVGRLTPDERLFLRTDLASVSDYTRQTGRAYITTPAGTLPEEAIENLFAGLPHAIDEAA